MMCWTYLCFNYLPAVVYMVSVAFLYFFFDFCEFVFLLYFCICFCIYVHSFFHFCMYDMLLLFRHLIHCLSTI